MGEVREVGVGGGRRLGMDIIHTYQTIAGSFCGHSSSPRWPPSKQPRLLDGQTVAAL